IPVWMSQGTHEALGAPDFDGLLHIAHDMDGIDLGAFQALPFTVPHDAREPLHLRCSDGASHMAVLTDLGHASDHVLQQLQGCQALMIEANHDPDRKSTRLNSSHVKISYAVFCLKKKK